MFSARFCASTLALVCGLATAHIAIAQKGAPSKAPGPVIFREGETHTLRDAERSLSDILDKLDWDPAARGTLLIVSPEEIRHSAPSLRRGRVMTADGLRAAQEEPEPETSGQFSLAHVADYYHRRLVNLPTASVFAPATMAVLKTHLPKPDAYAGMSAGDKAKLLESTFTSDQWRQVSSPEGIGAGELTPQQRDIFLSMLPEPFVVFAPGPPTTDESGVSRPGPVTNVTLSGDQRESVRISLARKFDWAFKAGKNSLMTFHSSNPKAIPGPRLGTPPMLADPEGSLFGVSLVENVPSHLKASQLPDNWQALEKTVNLDTAPTVGDLVKRIARQTGAELYCDPRFEDRKLYIRGTSGQAADICRALAWGLTGTWRRLGEAFVLTNDLVGLGTRHALIANWIRENCLLADIRETQTADALAKSHYGDYLKWSADDPLKPDDALNAKIEGYQRQGATDSFDMPYVPITELSAAEQVQIHSEIARQEEMQQRMKAQHPNMPEDEPVEFGSVFLAVNVQPTYEIQGVGSVEATDISFTQPTMMNGELHFQKPTRAPAENQADKGVAAPPPAIAFPSAMKNRVLLVDATVETDFDRLAKEAYGRGFTQLWVSTKRGEIAAIQAAVKAGTANHLTVQAVIPLIRPAPADKPELLDRNVLGETLTDFARRWKRQLVQLNVPEETVPTAHHFYSGMEPADAWRKATLVAHIRRDGDFLRCDDPAALKTICDDAAATVTATGLGGVVFRDLAAPGFNPPIGSGIESDVSNGSPGTDPLLGMGYDEATRLACLRKNGFDPIDLSPLSGGDHIQLPLSSRHAPPDIGLPFFPDEGPSPRNASFNDQNGTTTRAKDAWARWCAFRLDLDSTLLTAVAGEVRAKAPGVPIMVRRTSNPLSDFVYYFGSLDTPSGAAVQQSETSETPRAPSQPARSHDTLLDAARASSHVAYTSLRYDETIGSDKAERDYLAGLSYTLRYRSEWDGIVVDLSEASTARALEVLAAFPTVPAPGAKPVLPHAGSGGQ